MNKQKVVGLALVFAALVLIGLCMTSSGTRVASYLGKAVWYLPYAALVAGVSRLVRA